MFPLIEADTKLLWEFDCTALVIAESSLSTSVNTLDRPMVLFGASSLSVTSKIGTETVGASSCPYKDKLIKQMRQMNKRTEL